MKGSGIEVVGSVYPDDSTEQAPSLHHVVSLISREDDVCSVSSGGECGAGIASPEIQDEWYANVMVYVFLIVIAMYICLQLMDIPVYIIMSNGTPPTRK